MFTEALIAVGRIWKQPKCPSTDERIKNRQYIHKMGYHLALKKEEIPPYVTTWTLRILC